MPSVTIRGARGDCNNIDLEVWMASKCGKFLIMMLFQVRNLTKLDSAIKQKVIATLQLS